ncbi:MAG TPA: ParB/RepB/Spo0J family partition protein [Paracoccaceae bacterium]|nr:ParB/RepB/Spo0J family partition protein [Paracoccaceae bacterium]
MRLDHIPLDQIATDILPRDRTLPDPDADDDLRRSIATLGLLQPIEVFGIEVDDFHTRPWGLIAGHRRLRACQALGHTTIPAVLCTPADIPAALAAMVAENEVRAQITPWEKGRLLATLVEMGRFPDAPAAVAALYPSATRQQRARLRGFHDVHEAFNRRLVAPEGLSVARMDRLAMALRLGAAGVLRSTLTECAYTGITLHRQWEALRPVLNAILTEEPDAPHQRPRKPRHGITTHNGDLTLTRERTRTGWIIRFSGPLAQSPGLVDDVFDMVETWFR